MLDTWPEMLIAGIVVLLALLIVYAIIKTIVSGGASMKVGKDGVALVRKSALAEEEIERIAARLAESVRDHECKYHDYLMAVSGVIEPGMEVLHGVAEWAMLAGANGRVKANLPRSIKATEIFRAEKEKRALA
jgi:hypothetical protein